MYYAFAMLPSMTCGFVLASVTGVFCCCCSWNLCNVINIGNGLCACFFCNEHIHIVDVCAVIRADNA